MLKEVTPEDAGPYQCMLGAIQSSELVKGSQSIAVEVAREASLQFESSESHWVEGLELTASCSSLGGTPLPEVLAFLGGDQLESFTQEEEGEGVRLTFSLSPSREDSGKYLRCSSQQTDGEGRVLFSGPQEISKKVRAR